MFNTKAFERIAKSRFLRKTWPTSLKRDFCKVGFLKNYCWDNIKPCFIVGIGRVGTKFFAMFFNNYFNDTLSLHEPSPNLSLLGTNFVKGNISFHEAFNGYDFQRLNICRMLNKNNISFYIESNHNLSYLIPIVNKYHVNAKFAYIIRNGKDYVRSIYSKKSSIKDYYAFSKESERDYINPNDFSDDRFYGKWESMSRFERCCWTWVKRNKIIKSYLTNDIKFITVKFEDVFEGNHRGIWEIIDFFDLRKQMKVNKSEIEKVFTRKMNINKKYLLPENFELWPGNKKEIFKDICEEYMKELGYN